MKPEYSPFDLEGSFASPTVDSDGIPRTPRRAAAAASIGLSTAITSGMVVGILTWDNAPVVGGAAWPYIRLIVTVIATFVGFEIGVLLGILLVGVIFSVWGVIAR